MSVVSRDGPTHDEWYEIKRTWYPASELWQIADEQAKAARDAGDDIVERDGEVRDKKARTERRHALTGILFAHFAFEAYLNVSCETLLGNDLWALLNEGRSLNIKDKLRLAAHQIGCGDIAGREPFQTALNTKVMRNFVAHGRPVTATEQIVVQQKHPSDLPSDFEQAVKERFMAPVHAARLQKAAQSNVEKQCTAENAARAVSAVLGAADELYRLAEEAHNAGRIEQRIEHLLHDELIEMREIGKPASTSRKAHVETVVDIKDPELPSDQV